MVTHETAGIVQTMDFSIKSNISLGAAPALVNVHNLLFCNSHILCRCTTESELIVYTDVSLVISGN